MWSQWLENWVERRPREECTSAHGKSKGQGSTESDVQSKSQGITEGNAQSDAQGDGGPVAGPVGHPAPLRANVVPAAEDWYKQMMAEVGDATEVLVATYMYDHPALHSRSGA